MASITDVQRVAIDDLKPYEYNSKKHPEKQLKQLESSIQEFGFISPVLIDKDNNIIAGHGRTMAAKALGITEVPCVRIEGLTDQQKRAYIIADNRLTELGGWDKEILANELSVLDIEEFKIDLTGFNIDDVNDIQMKIDKPYGAERMRTVNAVNLIDYDNMRSYPPYDIPTLKACDIVPEDMIGFNYVLSTKDESQFKNGVHFFLDDYQFERVWNNPQKYIEKLKKFKCVCTPDFSPYADMPTAMKIWNVYRNRMIGQIFQDAGLNVIPTITWSDESTLDYVINGIQPGGTVAISTVTQMKRKEDQVFRDLFQTGIDMVVERIKPKTIILYSSKELDIDTKGIPVKHIKPKAFKTKE